MVYNPTAPVARILDLALAEVNAVQYGVTARWVFYRLLQAGVANDAVDLDAFDQVQAREDSITRQFRDHVRGLEIEEGDEEVEE